MTPKHRAKLIVIQLVVAGQILDQRAPAGTYADDPICVLDLEVVRERGAATKGVFDCLVQSAIPSRSISSPRAACHGCNCLPVALAVGAPRVADCLGVGARKVVVRVAAVAALAGHGDGGAPCVHDDGEALPPTDAYRGEVDPVVLLGERRPATPPRPRRASGPARWQRSLEARGKSSSSPWGLQSGSTPSEATGGSDCPVHNRVLGS